MFEQVLVRGLVDVDRVVHGAPTRPYLIDAIERGMGPCVRLLLDARANVNAVDTNCGRTPLMAAASRGHTVFAKQLIKLGANVDTRDHIG
jgi:ankyrin repeat protein